MKKNIDTPVFVAATTLAALFVVGAFLWRKKKTQKVERISPNEMVIPTKWTKIGEVKDLVIYPLKGAKRKCMAQAKCTKVGLKEEDEPAKLALRDRLFVTFNEKHEYQSIKKHTKMLFIETTVLNESTVKFSFPDAEDLIYQIPENNQTMTYVEIQNGEKVKTVDCGNKAAEWFSQRILNKPTGLRLGCFIESLVPARTIDGAYDECAKVYTKFHSEYMGTYHNLASYLLVSEASIMDLNSRISRSPVNEHYFRPNIVVKDSAAYSEDKWDWIKIGDDVVLRGFKYCTRCTITTVDPDTAVRDPKIEPYKTLKTYRQVKEPQLKKIDGTNPVMGLYAGCHRTGTIKVGDPVYIA